MVPPLHFTIHDEKGGSIVIEFVNGKTNIYDNSDVKVMTNDPEYSWHRDNLKKYGKLTNKLSSDDVQIKDDKRFVEARDGSSNHPFGKTIAVIGSSGVGKSTLINRIIGEMAERDARTDVLSLASLFCDFIFIDQGAC